MDSTEAQTPEEFINDSYHSCIEELHTPVCDSQMKLYVGQCFESVDERAIFYRKYALVSGFDVRLGSTRKFQRSEQFRYRYILCNREGHKNSAPDDVEDKSKKRRKISNRVGCMARVILNFKGAKGYMITKFIEEHTHSLVPESYKYLMKMNSKLGDGHKTFIIGCAKANIRPMKGYRHLKEVAGSHDKIGCNKKQVMNFRIQLKAFVEGSDAQMVIDKLFKKRELCGRFYFEYEVDKDDHLKSLFWVDPISRKNSWIYGDAVTFDATYQTNKHNMIFAPFTGKDNHGKCVTLGAALLTGESHTSYEWAFEHFKKSMGREPLILMTDQDPAIKVAFEKEFKEARHRLCMWHIMMKLPAKLSPELKMNKTFMKEFCNMVWSTGLEPHIFELQWKKVMDFYGLSEHEWFSSMYEIRETWLPAYFRGTRMGGLFRTSSASESENNFFKRYMSEHSNLLQFFMHFESALDSQRHTQAMLDNDDLAGSYVLRTKLHVEKHASSVYTRSIFNQVQDEIEDACYVCRLLNTTVIDTGCLYEFEDRPNKGTISVTYERLENNVSCSCQKFTMIGLLCSHIYYVFKDQNIEEIPDKYIVNRWTRLATVETSPMVDSGVLSSATGMEENRYVAYDAISTFYNCLGYAEGNTDKIHFLLNILRDTRDKFKDSAANMPTSSKDRLFEDFYQAPIPKDIVLKPPPPVSTKGSKSTSKARQESALAKPKKPPRKCSKCGEIGNHDARNCRNV